MQQKAFTLLNKGMNRDLSISKAGESSAYENHNIRIEARDNDTLLSVTNERGNKKIYLGKDANIFGDLIGWNVLNNHIVLFTHDEFSASTLKDYIYLIEYNKDDGTFKLVGNKIGGWIFNGDLGFDIEHPIESVVYYETEDIQKIYWVDGKHVLRFMNFMADEEEREKWDNTYFDSNRKVNFGVTAEITKDNSGNTRPNGVIQYLLTYYNKHGQESGIVWVSDLIYLSPTDKGGAADGTNSNKVTIELSNLDSSFTNYRVYSIFRSSLNGTPVAYIVDEGKIGDVKTVTRRVQSNTGRSNESSEGESGAHRNPSPDAETSTSNRIKYINVTTEVRNYATIVDDGAHLVAEDVSKLLYLGSQEVIAGTLAHKDQTLFIGDFQSIGKSSYEKMEEAVKTMYDDDGMCLESVLKFMHSYGTGDICDIPYHLDTGAYDYDSQLKYTSSQILSFKGGEKYRFALSFRRKDGTMSEAFWIGDAENKLYPIIDSSAGTIKRVVARCTIPEKVITAMRDCGFEAAQLMIAEATYADRSVKAQGILNPTMFNVWDRYNDRLYGEASWISRPRNSGFASRHFEPVHNSTSSTGEIDCNYWEEDADPTPYYRRSGSTYIDTFDGISYGDYRMILYEITHKGAYYYVRVYNINATLNVNTFNPSFDAEDLHTLLNEGEIEKTDYSVTLEMTESHRSPDKKDSAESLYPIMKAACKDELGLDIVADVIGYDEFVNTCHNVPKGETWVYNRRTPAPMMQDVLTYMNLVYAWESAAEASPRSDMNYTPSYYRKHLMFVDENLVTLNSPELHYEAVSFDNTEGYKLRIVGAAKITYTASDYTVDATPGKLPGENLIYKKFSGDTDGIISWPIWKEYGLKEKKSTTENPITIPSNYKRRTSEHYEWKEDPVVYWMHMWNHSGKINGYTDADNSDYSTLKSKVFANIRYSYCTAYNYDIEENLTYDIPNGTLRCYNYTSSQYVGLRVGDKLRYYDANIRQSLLPPGNHKYKVLYSKSEASDEAELIGDLAYLYLDTPVQIEYLSSPHAVFALPGDEYNQTILPYLNIGESDAVVLKENPIAPWLKDDSTPTRYYSITQNHFSLHPSSLADRVYSTDKYLLIGEIYYDFSKNDTRYGNVENNRFIVAGPQYTLSQLSAANVMYANQGDTYFQRWDCLKTKPADKTDAVNGVIDITSVMLETHINIDGRTDNQRETGYLASIDTSKYGGLNTVYSQQNNYFAQRDLDEDFNLDSYASSITWTLEKHDSAEVDEWSHITLANSLKLDGDKGSCRALRRFQNSIIAFQDRGIAEVLFNSRTQLTTTDGVPVELANSGKVDGKRYITNKFGCVNKWSIVEGKSALYFVDSINKAFCAFNGNVDSLSSRLGFDVWFNRANTLKVWTPQEFKNTESNSIVSFYDRINSDVYLVKNSADDEPCLVFNESLGTFTSFFDYRKVPMITNVEDRLVSFRDNNLWLQNEGTYCNFFGVPYDFWTTYRVTPDPYGDKIWTNVEYRADFYRTLSEDGFMLNKEDELITADRYGFINDAYKEDETFSTYKLWNEYQTTGDVPLRRDDAFTDPVRKKFRIWRLTIPRALKNDTNRHGLDRMRNPWINIEFRKHMDDDKFMMQLHDIVIKYFE